MPRKKRPKKSKDAAPKTGAYYTARALSIFQRNPSHRFTSKQIARKIHATGKGKMDQIEEVLRHLVSEGTLKEVSYGDFQLETSHVEVLEGKLDFVNPRFGFVIIEGQDNDIKISSNHINRALHGDIVKVGIFAKRRGRGSNPEGEIIEIVERANDTFVGRLQMTDKNVFVIPDSKRMFNDIYIPSRKGIEDKNNYKVVAQVTSWPEKGKNPEGKIVRVLGEAGLHETEMHAIMEEFGLDYKFPEHVQQYADEIPEEIPQEEIKKRRDFRGVTTFTIDPFDAKDFDDAISIQRLDSGNWEIGVHIADVTHYLEPGTILDDEAFYRATSTYLVDRTIPMLPEKLSNNLCSLRPHEDRLAFSAVFEIDDEAGVHSEWFGRVIIHSDRRFTYEEAQERIETKEGDYSDEINTLNKLAHLLRRRRFKKGAIAFETPEVKFKLAEDGKPLGVVPKIRKDAHKLVEDFMLLANKRVAEHVYELRNKGEAKSMVYRVHDDPDSEKLEKFVAFASRFGYKLDLTPGKISQSINNMVTELEGKSEENILQNLAVRAMSKAVYTTREDGHFGLAFPHYSHFTSPIRRYPDVLAHRLLQIYLNEGPSQDAEELERMCVHCSDKEKNAAEAERASIKYKQVEFMKDVDPEQKWNGVVSGVTEWGIYVEVVDNKCEGLVRITDLEDDYYEFDAANYRIVGRSNKNIISFGDEVVVTVKGTNLQDRTIDLLFVQMGHIDELVDQEREIIDSPEIEHKPASESIRSVSDEFGFKV